MKNLKRTLCTPGLLLLSLAVVAVGAIAQEPVPEKPFKTVHLLTLDAALETTLKEALIDLNQAMAKAGFPRSQYRLFKVHGNQQGPYSHLWEAAWAGRAEYDKIHNHREYKAAAARHQDLGDLLKRQVYNRFVEIPTKK